MIFLKKALQIAQLIRDYTSALSKQRGTGKRKSVEFDLMPKLQKTTANTTNNNQVSNPANNQMSNPVNNQMSNQMINGEVTAPKSSLAQHRQVHPMQTRLNPINHQQQILGQQQNHYSKNDAMQNALYIQKQQINQQFNAQQMNMQQQNGNNSSQFQPTHRRQRPLSILYKAPPVITTRAENV